MFYDAGTPTPDPVSQADIDVDLGAATLRPVSNAVGGAYVTPARRVAVRATGLGGRAGTHRYYKLPPDTWITETTREALTRASTKSVRLRVLGKNRRIGTSYGASRLHGQAPGVTVYRQKSIQTW